MFGIARIAGLNKSVKPKAMPKVFLLIGIGLASNSHSIETKYCPARSLPMVMLDGSDDNGLRHRIFKGVFDFAI